MNRASLLRSLRALEASLGDPDVDARRRGLQGLSDLEFAELLAAYYEADGVPVNPLCIAEEIGCECKREAWGLLGPSSIDANRAARRLHRGEEVNVACLYFAPGCECRHLAAAALREDTEPFRLRHEAGLLHRARAGAPPRTSAESSTAGATDEPSEVAEVKEEAPKPARRSTDEPTSPVLRPADEGIFMTRAERPPASKWDGLF